MDYQAFFASRESCRKYQTTPVAPDVLQRMVESAVTAPSACNSQPWHFTVVTQESLLPMMRTAVQAYGFNKFADNCPCFILISQMPAYVIDGKGGMCFDQRWAQVDLGLVTMQLTLAATAEGLGSCIIGAFDEVAIQKEIALPEGATLGLVLAVGHPVHPTARPKVRRALDETITYIK